MELLSACNQLLAFLLEVAMLCVLVYWVFRLSDKIVYKYTLPILVLLAIVYVWGAWLAPDAESRLAMPWLVLPKIGFFGAAATILYVLKKKNAAYVFSIAVIVSFVLSAITKDF